jgi:hypothetical protein
MRAVCASTDLHPDDHEGNWTINGIKPLRVKRFRQTTDDG